MLPIRAVLCLMMIYQSFGTSDDCFLLENTPEAFKNKDVINLLFPGLFFDVQTSGLIPSDHVIEHPNYPGIMIPITKWQDPYKPYCISDYAICCPTCSYIFSFDGPFPKPNDVNSAIHAVQFTSHTSYQMFEAAEPCDSIGSCSETCIPQTDNITVLVAEDKITTTEQLRGHKYYFQELTLPTYCACINSSGK